MKFFRPQRCSFSEDTACLAVYSALSREVRSLSPLRSSQSILQNDGCLPSWTGRDLGCARLKLRRRGSQDPVWEMPVSAWLRGALLAEVEPVEILLLGPAMPTDLSGSQAAGGGALLSDLTMCGGAQTFLDSRERSPPGNCVLFNQRTVAVQEGAGQGQR